MKRYEFNKLIRNKLPELMRNEGVVLFTKELSNEEYIDFLKEKIIEEAKEVREASSKDKLVIELADVIEVIHAIAKSNDISLEEIEQERQKKREVNGYFDADSYIKYIEVSEDNHKVIKYLEDKERHYKAS